MVTKSFKAKKRHTTNESDGDDDSVEFILVSKPSKAKKQHTVSDSDSESLSSTSTHKGKTFNSNTKDVVTKSFKAKKQHTTNDSNSESLGSTSTHKGHKGNADIKNKSVPPPYYSKVSVTPKKTKANNSKFTNLEWSTPPEKNNSRNLSLSFDNEANGKVFSMLDGWLPRT